MEYLNLYKISALLLSIGFLAHTFGGMLGTAKKGVGAGPEADEVLSKMKSVVFEWRGGKCSWYGFWMGNGLGVSALCLLAVTVLATLGSISHDLLGPLMPIAWATFVSLALLSYLGFKYFVNRIGIVFGLIAILTAIANLQVIMTN